MFVMKPPIGQGESQVIFCEPLWIQAMNRTFIWQSQNTWTSFLLSTGLSCPLSDFFFLLPFLSPVSLYVIVSFSHTVQFSEDPGSVFSMATLQILAGCA